jgi:hypothetical protein
MDQYHNGDGAIDYEGSRVCVRTLMSLYTIHCPKGKEWWPNIKKESAR